MYKVTLGEDGAPRHDTLTVSKVLMFNVVLFFPLRSNVFPYYLWKGGDTVTSEEQLHGIHAESKDKSKGEGKGQTEDKDKPAIGEGASVGSTCGDCYGAGAEGEVCLSLCFSINHPLYP